MHVVNEAPQVWLQGYSQRRDWYFNRLQGVYDKLRDYIQKLTLISQNGLAENYYSLNDRFYRSITPIIVAALVGIILVLLFNYFLNLYLIKPVIKINKGLKSYREYNKGYDVKFDFGRDQMEELNGNIKEIIEENRNLKKKL
jgi:methyl-accepting chemotaxis protein